MVENACIYLPSMWRGEKVYIYRLYIPQVIEIAVTPQLTVLLRFLEAVVRMRAWRILFY